MSKAAKVEVVNNSRMSSVKIVRKRVTRWFVRSIVGAILCAVILVWTSLHVAKAWSHVTARAEQLYGEVLSWMTRVEVRTELVKSDSIPLTQLVSAVSRKRGLPTVVMQAIIEQESGGGEHLYRFEPSAYVRLKSKVKASDSEVRMLASSHGVAHVMGFNAQSRCGVHWSKLYDPAIGLDCSARLIRENLERYANVRDASRRVWFALRDYNGAGPDAEAYADDVMARIGALLLGNMRAEL